MKILVSGKNSQIGNEFSNLILNSSDDYLLTSSESMNLLDENALRETILEYNPDIIINLSAYTKVDECENNKEKAYLINGKAPGLLADIALKINALLIHISTDYVFGNENVGPFEFNSITSPINYYGFSKLEGEKAIVDSKCNSIIIRTSSVFSKHGKNFIKTISEKILSDNDIKVVNDQMISMTCAGDLANTLIALIADRKKNIHIENNKSLIFHYTNVGFTTWYDVAILILNNLSTMKELTGKITPINLSDWNSKAKRPIDSRLLLDYDLLDSLSIGLYNWEQRVSRVLDALYRDRNN